MAERPASERTEQPTQRRLSKAREKGQVAQSQEVPSAVAMLVFFGAIFLMGERLFDWSKEITCKAVNYDIGAFSSVKAFDMYFGSLLSDSMVAFFPLALATCAAGVFGCIIVSGLNFAPEALTIKWDAVNPANGMKNLVNAKSLMTLLVSIAKIIVISIIVWNYLKGEIAEIAALRWAWSEQFLSETCRMIFGVSIRICIALIVIAAADLIFQKKKYIDELMMTRQEIKEEYKETDGSPEVKGRIRMIQRQMARKRMLKEVPKASVILVNPTHYAVALKYDGNAMSAPIVVAKGADNVAQRIREIAHQHGVPIIHRPELTRALYAAVEPGGAIPAALYAAVAEVLAMIYRLRGRK